MPSRFAIALSVALILVPGLASADAVKVRTGIHPGFGRIVFDWPADVHFTLSTGPRSAVLKFDRPIKADLAAAVNCLPAYLIDAHIRPDGRGVEFTLNEAFHVRTVENGHSIGLDFVELPHDAAQKPASPPAPALAAVSAPARQKVTAPTANIEQVGPAPTTPKAEKPQARSGGSAPIGAKLPETADGGDAKHSAAPPSVPTKAIQPPASASVAVAKRGRQPAIAKTASPAALVKGVAEPAVKASFNAPISIAEKPDFTRIVFPWPSTKYRLERRGRETVMVFERGLDPDLAMLRVDKPKGVLAASGKKANGRFGLHLRLAPGYAARSFVEGNQIVLDLVAPKPAPAPVAAMAAAPKDTAKAVPTRIADAVKPTAATPAQAPVSIQAAAPANTPAPTPVVTKPVPAAPSLKAVSVGEGTRLIASWPVPVAAAVFERAGRLWAVFDGPAKLDLTALPLADLPGIGTMEQLPNTAATVLRVPLKPGFGARVVAGGSGDQAGTQWLIDIVPQPVPPMSLNVVTEYHAVGGPRLRIDALGATAALKLGDPDVGDALTVVPMLPGRGLAIPRRFVECTLLGSAQGLAIEPQADGLDVQVAANAVTISVPGGLAVSEPDPALASTTLAPGAIDQPKRAALASEWRDEPVADFAEKRAALAQAEAAAPEAEVSGRRLALALFYLHNNLAAEALGLLDMAAKQDPSVAATGAYHAARGQAQMLMGRPKDADRDLGVPELAADPDALMWRGWALTAQHRWLDAAQTFQAAQMATLNLYPVGLRATFMLAAARTALESGHRDDARRQLAGLPDGLPAAQVREAALLSGEIAEQSGDDARALTEYTRAAGTVEGPIGARASLRATLLNLKLGHITKAAAIGQLEQLSYAWRGDDTERATIAALGDLYLADGRYREAFAAYDEVDRLFADAPQADAVRARMRSTFADLFLNGKADKMEPVKALGLFLDYRDLTPVGREGDDMIRKLADRLASVDLLDQAEAVLDYQIKNRLEGAAKAQIATKLAALALLNHDPQRALNAIRETRLTALPDDLNRKRRMVEAQALMELGQNDGALEMIARFTGPDADGLRAEIHWRAREWPQAAQGMMAVLNARPKGAVLSQSDRQIVMKAAISYALAGDQAGLGALRDRYHTVMLGSADADAFEVLTGPIDVEGVKFRELAAKIAGLDSLQGFLKSYKESL